MTIEADIASGAYWIDKLLIAVLIAIAGTVARIVIVRAKLQLTFKNELVKEKVVRTGEVLSAIYKCEATSKKLSQGLIGKLSAHKTNLSNERVQALKKKFKPMETEMLQQADAATELLEENRFWLGARQYEDIQQFWNLIVERAEKFAELDLPGLQAIDRRIEDTRKYVEDYGCP